MPNPALYRRISERYLQATDATVPSVSEAGGFDTYHDFESVGCAWIRHNGQVVPRGHTAKLNRFVNLSRGRTFGYGVSVLATTLNSIRNNMLYPIADATGGYRLPEQILSAPNANDLLRRVRAVINRVSSQL